MALIRKSGDVVSLDEARAKKFLLELADKPFVALVLAEGGIKVYTHDAEVGDATLRTMKKLLDDLATGST